MILATDLAKNDKKLRESYNPNDPLKSLYTGLKKCQGYATVAGKPITEGQVVCISYSLVAGKSQFQEDCQTW